MAIVKGIENIYGAKFSYHKLSDVRIAVTANGIQLRMIVESYMDKDARKTGKQPVRTENIIENADFALTPFYKLLKAKFADYAGSEDDFEDSWKTNELEETKKKITYTQQTVQGKLISKYEE